MANVVLNLIQATLAQSPETSAYTSVKRRIEAARETRLTNPCDQKNSGLLPFACNLHNDKLGSLPCCLSDYLELVDWSGHVMREDKKGRPPEHVPDILVLVELDSRHWLYLTQYLEDPFKHLVGAAHHVRKVCEVLGQGWVQGISQCERLFSSG